MNREDFTTAAWKRLRGYLLSELEERREENDNPAHDAVKTAGIRGEIRALKKLLDLERDYLGSSSSTEALSFLGTGSEIEEP